MLMTQHDDDDLYSNSRRDATAGGASLLSKKGWGAIALAGPVVLAAGDG